MSLDADVCYRALETRDARFDGRFFTGVRSTGIYCRPICPARTPKRENCRFFACAAAAQEAGFRPCLRCRPESSPGTPAWIGTCATVSRALRLIADGALDEHDVHDLAARLGIGERHLRRLFLKHLGAPPLAVAQNRRILFAKKLIDETDLSMTEVGLSSGFQSVRRFNDAIRRTYGRTPSELRRARRRVARPGAVSTLELKLPFRPPLQWKALVDFLGARAIPGVEEAGPSSYRRTLRLGEAQGTVEVVPIAGEHALRARLDVSSACGLTQVVERLRRVFDLGADPASIMAHLGTDRYIGAAVRKMPGLRVPGAWDGFELAVRAILGQQVSVKGATTLAGRVADLFGDPLCVASGVDTDGGTGLRTVFPSPERLAEADLTRVGLPRARARAISTLAAAVASGDLVLDSARNLTETVDALSRLPGVGEWTAHYVAMRALGEPDAFPAMDLGLRRALGNGAGPVSVAALERVAEKWRPWRAYASVYLWTMIPNGTKSTKRTKGRTRDGALGRRDRVPDRDDRLGREGRGALRAQIR